MKYTILGFDQKVAVNLKLNINHLLLLNYFKDFRNTDLMVTKVFNGEKMYWLKYEAILNNLPILGIKSKIVLRRYLKQLEDAKVLTYKCEKTSKGTYTFYGLGEKYWDLQYKKKSKNILENDERSTELDSLIGLTNRFSRFEHKRLPRQTKMFNQNIKLLKHSSIKNIRVLKEKNNIKLSSTSKSIKEIIFILLSSVSDYAYSTWFADTIMIEEDGEIIVKASDFLINNMPTKYINIIQNTLNKKLVFIKE